MKLLKQLLSFILISTITASVMAQTPAQVWEQSFGGDNEDASGEGGQKIMAAHGNGFIVCGTTLSTNIAGGKGAADAWLVQYAGDGTLQWQKAFGGSGIDFFSGMDVTPEGGYILAGRTNSADGDVSGGHGGFDIWVVKTDDTGAILWQKCYGGSGLDGYHGIGPNQSFRQVSVKSLGNDGYILSAPVASNDGDISGNHGGRDVWIARLDNNGTILWQHCYGGTGNDYPSGEIYPTTDGGYIVGGSTESNNGDVTGAHGASDYWLLKTDSTGQLQWQKTLGGSGIDYGIGGVCPVTDGYVIAGTSRSADGDVTALGGGTYDWWVVKVDNNGAVVWNRAMGNTGTITYDYLHSITTTTDNGVLLAGIIDGSADGATSPGSYDGIGSGSSISGPHNGGTDAWLVKLDAAGNIVWEENFGTFRNEGFNSVLQHTDGSLLLTGFRPGANAYQDWWTVRLSACPAYTYLADTICKGSSISFGGQLLTVAGIYNDTLAMTGNGCDSLVQLTLFVDSISKPEITANGSTLTTGSYAAYQWLDGNNNPISNATSGSYEATGSGSYRVVVWGATGCTDTSAVYNLTITGMEALPVFAGLRIYPNPAAAACYLTIPALSGNGTVRITSLDGKMVAAYSITGGKTHIIPVLSLAPGLYLLRIDVPGGSIVRKLIKE